MRVWIAPLISLLVSLSAGLAQAVDFSAFEKSARMSHNSENKQEGLFLISYEPIPPASIGIGTATRSLSRGASGANAGAEQFDYQAFAKNFMIQHQDLLDVTSADDLQYLRETTDSVGGRHLRFTRYYKSIRLDKMEVIVHFNGQKNVTGINGHVTRLPSDLRLHVDQHLASGGTVIDGEAALAAIARNEQLSVQALHVARQEALITTTAPYVVWELNVGLATEMSSYVYRVSDEPSPRILSKISTSRY